MGRELSTTGALHFDEDTRALIHRTCAAGAPKDDFDAMIYTCERRGLDPLLKQVYFVQRWQSGRDGDKGRMVWAIQSGIDGLRAIAQRTQLYDGQDEPEFIMEKGAIVACRVKVYRKDWGRPSVAVAWFSEYAQTKKDGGLTQFWQNKPHVMLAKCAEALALRKAFPEDTGGIYIAEEMGETIDVTPEPAQRPALTEPAPKVKVPPMTAAEAMAHVERVTAEPPPTVAEAKEQPPVVDAPSVADGLMERLMAAADVAELNRAAAEIKAARDAGQISEAERNVLADKYTRRKTAMAQGVQS